MSITRLGLIKPSLVSLGIIRGLYGDGCFSDFYYFDPAKPSNLTLNTPFTGELTLLFSTFNGVTGLPAEFADATVINAPAGAKSDPSLYAGTGQQVTRTVTGLTQVIGATFDGVLWGYALDGVWHYVNQGQPLSRLYYETTGNNEYISLNQPASWGIGEAFVLAATVVTNATAISCVFGQGSSDNWFLNMLADGRVTFSNLITSSSVINDGLKHRIVVERDQNNLITLHVDGELQGSFTREWDGSIDTILANFYGLNFIGTVYDVVLKGVDYPINDGWEANPSITPNSTAINFVEGGWYIGVDDTGLETFDLLEIYNNLEISQ